MIDLIWMFYYDQVLCTQIKNKSTEKWTVTHKVIFILFNIDVLKDEFFF